MDKNILETVLRRNWKETSLEKVVSVEGLPAVEKNMNFLSDVKRLTLKVVLGSGRVVNKSVIMKVQGTDPMEFQFEFNKRFNTFKTETEMYNALRQMEYLMEEFEDTEDVLWCNMIHHIPYSCIVLEDLKVKGFDTIERNRFYNLDEILLSVHSLGRYHGMTKALEGMGLAPQGLNSCLFFFHDIDLQTFMYFDLMALKRSVITFWDPTWTPIVEKIKITKDEFHERLKKLSELDETKFNVTNHGDCHKNNIVIKYNCDKLPIAMRFLDFQLANYGSPCTDLTYMIYLAAEPSVRRDHYDLILRTYHNALENTLDKYHFEGKKPDLEEIRDGMEKYSFMGLMLALSWYVGVLKSDKTEEMRDFIKMKETDGKEGYSDEYYKPDPLENNIGPDIKAFVDRFCS
ncbi:uncharacterized protein [Halyomorpha halys]|uniref:uncharacterized protein n=1 Tax=Halyomorpha halys TaxID=286706 RepID=UPI0006D4EA8E|nr:uncharacterized protein LOC106682402 [Halyomorpha halys]